MTSVPSPGAPAPGTRDFGVDADVFARGRAGLTGEEARERLRRFGPNAVPEQRPHPTLLFLRKLWAPVPWMLELTLALELALGRITQAAVIAALLVLNATVSFVQEGRARNAVALLRRRLTVRARVLRDGRWQLAPAEDLVPGDVVHLRQGDLVPADLRLDDGRILEDRSTLTGETTPADLGPGEPSYAGGIVQRGEATGEVTATGPRTLFGKTAELVRTAAAPGHLQTVIFAVVKYLVAMDVVLAAAVLVYSLVAGLPPADAVPFALILLVASVPVALPATYTLATALGSLELSERGVLVTRLSAVEEAAAMDVLCADKTGTLTQNRLVMAALHPYPPHTDDDLLRLAALASDEATQDPIDLAVLAAAKGRGLAAESPGRLRFFPFDPATKRSEALVREAGAAVRVVKGAPTVVTVLAPGSPDPGPDVERFGADGYRVLAVAAGPDGSPRLAGLVALLDPPREDSRAVVRGLADLGVRVVMVTGDGLATAREVAARVGIEGRACGAEALRAGADGAAPDCAVYAGVLPEDKFRLVSALQRTGRVVGMTGDGVNDAPALKQAEVGVAVANAADVAKAAASLVLTRPGLSDLPGAVETGRRVYQRLLSYTLNKVVKTFQVALFLSLGLVLTGTFVTTPLLVLLLLFANDFVTMSLAADRVSFSRSPDRWRVRRLAAAGLALALAWLAFSFAVFYVGRDALRLGLPQLQTLVFLMFVFTGQANVYLVRERGPFWTLPPGRWLAVSSAADLAVVGFLATRGILMAPVSSALVAGLLGATAAYFVALDFLKVRLFRLLAVR